MSHCKEWYKMIEAYFGLKKVPFTKDIKSKEIFDSYDHREAFSRLGYIKIQRGLMLLTGEPGSGKTTLLRKFVEDLNAQSYQHCYTPHATVSKSELYRQLSSLLQLPSKMFKSALFEQVQKTILEAYEHQGKTTCIILDECHLMDHQTLSELVLLTNFEMDSKLPFILVLVGQPELREKLKRRMHEPLNQRITLRYHMAGLSLDETKAYVLHHLQRAGRRDPLFEEAGFEVLHRLAMGLPRKVGNLAYAAMTTAMVTQKDIVSADIILQASGGI